MTVAEPKFKRLLTKILTLFSIFSFSALINAQGLGGDDDFLPVEEAYQVLIQVNEQQVNMDWTLASGYYLYQDRFKLTVRNLEESQQLPLEFEAGKEKYDDYFEKNMVVYYYNTHVSTSLPKIKRPYELLVESMGCADAGLCYPPRKQYFQVSENGQIVESQETRFEPALPEQEEDSDAQSDTPPDSNTATAENQSLWVYLVFAFVGGMILNLMPCVFPVLSLKALSFASARQHAHEQHMHGWAYTAGVVASFLLAASIILSVRGAGGQLGWGFQLQEPGFVTFMVYLFFLMGLSLSGMFHIGSQWMGAGQGLTSGKSIQASFFTGVLAALVASPCTAPLMATALGVALTLATFPALLIFISLGLGMAFPFLLLSYNPKLAEKLPAPGPWMDTLKQFLAFPMYATCIWLLWVLGHQTSSDGAALVILGGLLLTFAIWLHNLQLKSGITQQLIRLLMLGSLLASVSAAYLATTLKNTEVSISSGEIWLPYSPEKLAELRAQNIPVFIDLTADWCITCKFNERVALTTKVEQAASNLGVVLMLGDWTNPNADISALLQKYSRSGVPLYLMYPVNAKKDAEILPQILTENIVLDAMERAL